MIVLGDTSEVLSKKFGSVEKVATVYHPYSLPYRHFDVYLCRGPKFGTLQQNWPKLKHWN
jgi:hypothetical protein